MTRAGKKGVRLMTERGVVTINLESWRLALSVLVLALTLAASVWGAVSFVGSAQIRSLAPEIVQSEVKRQLAVAREQMRREQQQQIDDIRKELRLLREQLAGIDARTTSTQRSVELLLSLQLERSGSRR